MALKPCKECGKEVSTEAQTCPHCGVKFPTTVVKKTTAKESLYGLIALCVLVAIGVAMCSDSDKEKAEKAAKAAAADAACKKDLQCLGDKVSYHAGTLCGDMIESRAKNNAKWTDGTLESKFSHFRWKNQQAVIITMIGDKVQFQNGYGAYTNMIYECDIDASADPYKAIGVRVREGRINY